MFAPHFRDRVDLPKKKKYHLESGLNQRDRATAGFVRVHTHRKPGKKIHWRGFAWAGLRLICHHHEKCTVSLHTPLSSRPHAQHKTDHHRQGPGIIRLANCAGDEGAVGVRGGDSSTPCAIARPSARAARHDSRAEGRCMGGCMLGARRRWHVRKSPAKCSRDGWRGVRSRCLWWTHDRAADSRDSAGPQMPYSSR